MFALYGLLTRYEPSLYRQNSDLFRLFRFGGFHFYFHFIYFRGALARVRMYTFSTRIHVLISRSTSVAAIENDAPHANQIAAILFLRD